jgi:hypothetical protein
LGLEILTEAESQQRLIDGSRKPAEILGFDFEIRFPESVPIEFFRFDLNLPGHDNQTDGLRFHLHPGSAHILHQHIDTITAKISGYPQGAPLHNLTVGVPLVGTLDLR